MSKASEHGGHQDKEQSKNRDTMVKGAPDDKEEQNDDRSEHGMTSGTYDMECPCPHIFKRGYLIHGIHQWSEMT